MTRTDRFLKCCVVIGLVLLRAGNAWADLSSYYIWDTWGGTWADAEKTSAIGDDEAMCWAAASANVLEYTRWGKVGGMRTTDDMYAYFRTHFTNAGGNPYYAYGWWWNGTNDVQGLSDWAQEMESLNGGGFYLALDIDNYRRWTGDYSSALSTLDGWMREGYASTLVLSRPGLIHAITAWGFTYDSAHNSSDPGYYTGIWVTDADDDKNNPLPPDSLRHYDLLYQDSTWYLNDYFGGDTTYISEVCGLKVNAVPVPGAALLGVLGLSVAGVGLRKRYT